MSTLTLPTGSAGSNAAISLLVQIYIQPHLPSLKVTQGSELSLTTVSSSPKTGEFLPIFKSLLEEAGQISEALGTEDRKSVEHWITAATSAGEFPTKDLDGLLVPKTYIAESRCTAADVAVFGSLQSYISQASHDTLLSHPNVTRHFDLIQHTPSVITGITKLPANTLSTSAVTIDLDNVPVVERKVEPKKDKKKDAAATTAANAGNAAEKGKGKGKKVDVAAAAADNAVEPAADGGKSKKEKKEKQPKEAGAEGGKPKKDKAASGGNGAAAGGAAAASEEISPGLIDLRVGIIVDVQKHPDADSLYVEKIDFGEAEPRTVVSGLVNYVPIEQMRGKKLVGVCNLKPASMRGVKSFAMVLCATSKEGKTGMGSVEVVDPPAGSKPGDRIYFEGFEDVTALEQLPPKKKIFETFQPGLITLENKECAYVDPKDSSKVHRIVTKEGPCTAPNFVGASLS